MYGIQSDYRLITARQELPAPRIEPRRPAKQGSGPHVGKKSTNITQPGPCDLEVPVGVCIELPPGAHQTVRYRIAGETRYQPARYGVSWEGLAPPGLYQTLMAHQMVNIGLQVYRFLKTL